MPEAKRLQEESLAIAREIDFQIGIGWRLLLLGDIANCMGIYGEALAYAYEGVQVSQRCGYPFAHSMALSVLGETLSHLGRFAEARHHLREALTIAMRSNVTAAALLALANLASLLIQEENTGVDDKQLDSEQPLPNERYLLAAEFLNLISHHQGGWYVFKERAARWLIELEGRLPSEIAAAARRQGQSMTLEAAGERALMILTQAS